MAIYRLLQNSAFEPQDADVIVAAYESALRKLGLRDGLDPLNETVAQYIFEAAQTGEKDPAVLCDTAIRWLRQRNLRHNE